MAVATGVIGAGTGLAKFFEGRAMQKRAQNNIDNFKFEDLTNSYKNLRVSTLGSDLQIDFAAAGQDASNQQMMEKRQTDELAGFGAMLGAGQKAKFDGMTDMLNAGVAMSETEFGAKVDNSIGKGVKGLFK